VRVTSDVGPFAITPEWVLDASISDRAVRLYGLLGRYADANGSSFPSRRTLADRLRCSVDSVDRAAKELVTVGALQIAARRTDSGDQTTNLYRLIHAAPVRTPLGTVAATPIRTPAAQNENQPERKNTLAATPRKRNKIWDALTYVFGEPTTKTATQVRGKVCASLTQAGATPDQVVARASAWPAHFDSAVMTDLALEKHWDTLGRRPLRRR
jgi:DNA-binding transcriptional MocR family regulator